MVAAIDIGNSRVHCALFKHKKIIRNASYSRDKGSFTSDIKKFLEGYPIKGAACASVVPDYNRLAKKFFKENYGFRLLFVSPENCCDLVLDYDRPETLGADRIANVVGSLARYQRDTIIVDFGTAITIDVGLMKGQYLGGIILPGARATVDALVDHTAQLDHIVLDRKPKLLGHSTEECIQSGVINGITIMIHVFLKKIKNRYKRKFFCIATGGWGRKMRMRIKAFDRYDKTVGLFGIVNIYYHVQNRT